MFFTRHAVIALCMVFLPAFASANSFEESRVRLHARLQSQLTVQLEKQHAVLAATRLGEQTIAFDARARSAPWKLAATPVRTPCVTIDANVAGCTLVSHGALFAAPARDQAAVLPASPAD